MKYSPNLWNRDLFFKFRVNKEKDDKKHGQI